MTQKSEDTPPIKSADVPESPVAKARLKPSDPMDWPWRIIFYFFWFILMVLLLIAMRLVFCPCNSGSPKIETELQAINDSTAAIQKAISDERQQEKADAQSIQTTLGTCTTNLTNVEGQLVIVHDRLSQMPKGSDSAEISRQLSDINGNIAAVRQSLNKLQSTSSRKQIGLININSH
jgi:hypothetical protein